MKLNKEKIEEVLEEFNKEIDTKIENRRKTTPILINIFEQFYDELYGNSKVLKESINQKQKIVEIAKLDCKQKELMQNYDELECLILDDMVERGFLYGFFIAKEIEKEKINIKT